jgi:4-diphosphocytidyl-2-C-methyl-D-erythritol kinase
VDRRIVLSSPAKINLHLAVLGRRADGYHDIETHFQTVSLADTVAIALAPAAAGITVTTSDPALPRDEENLAGRAARALLDAAGLAGSTGVAIHVDKRIPAGAGLGGGSGDAATVFVGLNELLDLRWGAARLETLAARVGSDVPFLVRGGAAIGRGRGEILTPLPPLDPIEIVLAKPDVSVSTAWAYAELSRSLTAQNRASIVAHTGGAVTLNSVLRGLWNAFEPIVMRHHPQVREIRDRMLAAGALGALMTGSGPTVFGLFADSSKRRDSESSLRSCSNWSECVVPVAGRRVVAS